MFLGRSALIEVAQGAFHIRPPAEIEALLAAAYGQVPIADLRLRLEAIANHLRLGDVAHAMIATLLLRLGELSEDAGQRLADAEAVLKYNFNPAEPRDERVGGPPRNRAELQHKRGSLRHRRGPAVRRGEIREQRGFAHGRNTRTRISGTGSRLPRKAPTNPTSAIASSTDAPERPDVIS